MSAHWQAWFFIGVVRFGLRPRDFWALSLSEWQALLSQLDPPGACPPARAELDRLRAEFPDTCPGASHGTITETSDGR